MENLFQKGRTSAAFKAVFDSVKKKIENLSNEEICCTDLGELEEYYVNENQIEQLELFKENITSDLSETKIKEYNRFFRDRYDDAEYYMLDGYKMTYIIPFDGNEDLLYLKPSSWYDGDFPVDRVIAPTETDYGKIIISFDYKKSVLLENAASKAFLQKDFQREMQTYYEMIDRVNQDVQNFNKGFPSEIRAYLDKRKQKAKDYLQIRERLELPLKLNPDAPNIKPVLLKKVKKKKELPFPNKAKKEPEYEIADADYENIKNIILLACVSMEKSARTFAKLMEEELRDIILSHLNTHYQGTASGETFSRMGKTDIYIPFDNKAAYIAECKIWHGSKKFLEAVDQLCGYATWRDTKTSLIIFNKDNKDFLTLLDSVDKTVRSTDRCKEVIRRKENEWQGKFAKEAGGHDIIKINIMVYNLYIKEM